MSLNFRVSDSNYAMLIPLRGTGSTFYSPVGSFTTLGTERVRVALIPEDSADEGFLSSLSQDAPYAFAFKNYVALLNYKNSHAQTSDRSSYIVDFDVLRTEFTPEIEPSFGSLSADDLAQMRAERLLFNKHLPMKSRDWSEGARELFVRGQDTAITIIGSPFPLLYEAFSSNSLKFLQLAWIAAAGLLKLSACVTQISHLELALVGSELLVEFRGERRTNRSGFKPLELELRGTCFLTSFRHDTVVVDISQLGPKLKELSIKVSLVRVPPGAAEQLKGLVAQIDRLLSGLPPR